MTTDELIAEVCPSGKKFEDALEAWEQEQGVVGLFVFDRPRLAKLVETLGLNQQEFVRTTPLREIKCD
jgi:hypothetical protein